MWQRDRTLNWASMDLAFGLVLEERQLQINTESARHLLICGPTPALVLPQLFYSLPTARLGSAKSLFIHIMFCRVCLCHCILSLISVSMWCLSMILQSCMQPYSSTPMTKARFQKLSPDTSRQQQQHLWNSFRVRGNLVPSRHKRLSTSSSSQRGKGRKKRRFWEITLSMLECKRWGCRFSALLLLGVENKSQGEVLPGLSVRLPLLSVTDPISACGTESERERRKGRRRLREGRGGEKGPWARARRAKRAEREARGGKARKCLWAAGGRRRRHRREKSGGSGALTRRFHTLRGMCWQWEVVLLSQMTSPSLLKTIG